MIVASTSSEVLANRWASAAALRPHLPTIMHPTFMVFGDSLHQARSYHGKRKRVLFKDCESIDSVLRLRSKEMDKVRPSDISAAWSRTGKLLSNRSQRQQNEHKNATQREIEINELLDMTMSSLEQLQPQDLATITYAMAKIVSRLRKKTQQLVECR